MLIVAMLGGLGLVAAPAHAWSGGRAFAGPPARAEVGSSQGRYGSLFGGPTLGELQNEAWGQYLNRQYLLNNPRPRLEGPPRPPTWVWVAPAWQWNGFQWVWVPGHWAATR